MCAPSPDCRLRSLTLAGGTALRSPRSAVRIPVRPPVCSDPDRTRLVPSHHLRLVAVLTPRRRRYTCRPCPPSRPFGNCRIACFSRGPELHPPFAPRERSERLSCAIFTFQLSYFCSNATPCPPPSSPSPLSSSFPLPPPGLRGGGWGRRGSARQTKSDHVPVHLTSPRRPSPPRSRGSSPRSGGRKCV